MRRDFAKDSDCQDYHPRRVHERRVHLSRARLPTETHKTHTSSHRSGRRGRRAHARKAAGIAACMRSSRWRRASAHANSLPNPLISGPRNAGALNGYRIAGSRRGWRSPSSTLLRRSSLPPLLPLSPRVLSFPFRCSLVHPSTLPSLFLTRFAHSFPRPFSPLSPSNRPSSLSVRRPNVRTPAYTFVTTYYYGLLLILAYYEQWRIDDLSSRPSPREQPRGFLPGNFQEGRKGDAYSATTRFMYAISF